MILNFCRPTLLHSLVFRTWENDFAASHACQIYFIPTKRTHFESERKPKAPRLRINAKTKEKIYFPLPVYRTSGFQREKPKTPQLFATCIWAVGAVRIEKKKNNRRTRYTRMSCRECSTSRRGARAVHTGISTMHFYTPAHIELPSYLPLSRVHYKLTAKKKPRTHAAKRQGIRVMPFLAGSPRPFMNALPLYLFLASPKHFSFVPVYLPRASNP